MPRPVALLLLAALLAPSPARADRLGATAGFPQVVGLEWERRTSPDYTLRAHVGTLVLVSSVGIRASYDPAEEGFGAFVFGGGGFLAAVGQGAGPYLWAGPGLVWRGRSTTFLVEVASRWPPPSRPSRTAPCCPHWASPCSSSRLPAPPERQGSPP